MVHLDHETFSLIGLDSLKNGRASGFYFLRASTLNVPSNELFSMALPNETPSKPWGLFLAPLKIEPANHRSASSTNAPISNFASQPPNPSSHLTATRTTSIGSHIFLVLTLVISSPSHLCVLSSEHVSHLVSFREAPGTCDGPGAKQVRAQTKAIVRSEAVVLSWPFDLETAGEMVQDAADLHRRWECSSALIVVLYS